MYGRLEQPGTSELQITHVKDRNNFRLSGTNGSRPEQIPK